MRVVFVPVDGKPVELESGEERTLSFLQKLVGGYIERVRTEELQNVFGRDVVMIVNEIGHIEQRPKNRTMSSFYRGELGIAGDAVLVGEGLVWVWDEDMQMEVEDMDFIDVPVGTLESLQRFIDR